MDVCSICLENFSANTCSCKLPGCGHTFHVSCILNVVQYDIRCPICRNTIPNVNTKKEDSDNTIISLETLYNDYQRKKRQYMYKKRKFIKNDKKMENKIIKLKHHSKELRDLQTEMDKLWSEKSRKLWSEDDDILLQRKKTDKLRKKCYRMEKNIDDTLESALGLPPHFEDGIDSLFEIFS
jgi:DNA repair exonuclease SbcCD ATPase subunit